MKYSFVIALLLGSALAARAQRSSIDLALDSYAAICDECIALKAKALSGEKVSSEAFSTLLGQLSSLRATLSKADSGLTPSQRLRLQSIRLRYEEAFPSEAQTASRQELPKVDFPRGQILLPGASALKGSSTLPAPRQGNSGGKERTPASSSGGFTLMALVGFPPGYLGVAGDYGSERLGCFVKVTAFPSPLTSEYSCLSDGTTPSGGFVWTTGKERMAGYSFSAGLRVAAAGPLSVYSGVGYGSRSILWEDTSSRWAKVDDLSRRGLVFDAGFVLRQKRFRFVLGASSIGFKTLTPEFGIGFSFK